MFFIRLETSDGGVCWINLNQISRATLSEDEAGTETIVVVFADGHVEDKLQIRGTDDVNREAICRLRRALNQHCEME
ncbi:MAG: hypothetical protein AB8G99_06385 [Planctomycetaceae bacterium]